MKNLLVLALIFLCSVWLLWIKLNQVSPIETSTVSSREATSSMASKPKTEREVYQALNGLIRVFESDLTLDNLTPITVALNTDLPRMRLEDRYRIYTQLDQALAAYTRQLDAEQADLLERYAALHSQRSQQIDEPQQLDTQQQPPDETDNSSVSNSSEAASQTVTPTEPTDQQDVNTAPDVGVAATLPTNPQNEPDQRLSTRVAEFEQQWSQLLKQGLSSKQQQLLNALAKQQIEVVYAGEGSFAFRLNPNYWVIHLAPHLAKADQVYLKQMAEQTQQPFADDAGLLISWLELGERVQAWMQYTEDYPDGYFTELAQAKRDDDLSILLMGMDNTPTHQQGVLLPEVRVAYAQLARQYPNSRLSKTLSLFEQQLAEQPDAVPTAARRAIALAKDQISR